MKIVKGKGQVLPFSCDRHYIEGEKKSRKRMKEKQSVEEYFNMLSLIISLHARVYSDILAVTSEEKHQVSECNKIKK